MAFDTTPGHRMRMIVCIVLVSCFLLAFFNPLRWWFPRRGGERSPGTTTGWLQDAGPPPAEATTGTGRPQLV